MCVRTGCGMVAREGRALTHDLPFGKQNPKGHSTPVVATASAVSKAAAAKTASLPLTDYLDGQGELVPAWNGHGSIR